MKDYKKDFNDKLEDGSFCDGELISIANGYITEMQDIITELEKDKQYFSDRLDKQIEATLKLHKEYQELEAEVKEWKDKADLWCKTANLKDHNIMINKELEKENAELKKQLEMSNKVYNDNLDYSHHIEEQLTKAKDHIKKLLDCLKQDTNDPQTNYYVCQYMDKAEQFLSEVEK